MTKDINVVHITPPKVLGRNLARVVIFIWLIVLSVTAGIFFFNQNIDALSIAITLFTLLKSHWWGFILFLMVAALRPLILIPISSFSILSGACFGFWFGIIITYLSVLASALVAYSIGWQFRHLFKLPTPPKLLKDHPFESILLLHLTMLPFDVLNYFLGSQHVRFRPFIMAVAVGMIPGTLSLTAFGASIKLEEIAAHGLSPAMFDWRYVALAVVIYIVSFTVSRLRSKNY